MYYLPEEEKENRRAVAIGPRGKVREILSLFSKEDSCARDIAENWNLITIVCLLNT